MDRMQRTGVILIAFSALAYALIPVFAKWVYDAGMEPLDVVTWRFIISTPLMWLVVWLVNRRSGRNRIQQQAERKGNYPYLQLLLLGVVYAALASVDFIALQRIPASLFIVLVYIYPAIIAVVTAFSGQSLSPQGWAALALTSAGVVLTVPEVLGGLGMENVDPLGLGLGLLSAVLTSTYMILSNRLLAGRSETGRATALNISGALVVLVGLAAFNGLSIPGNLTAWVMVLALSLIGTVGAIFTLLMGIQRVGPARAAILSTLEPMLVLVFSALILGEHMTPIQMAGGLLIISSPIILNLRPRMLARRRQRGKGFARA